MSVSDEALLAGVAAGDDAAMAGFVRRYQARIYGLALTIVGTPAAAEEVAQDAFVRAWRHAGNFDPRRAQAITWLLTITRNIAIDVVRVRRERATDPVVIADMVRGSTDDDGDRMADRDRIAAALRGLPREKREAVLLSVVFGLTAREIAERERIPVGTAKSRIRAGLLRLRSMLEVAHD